MTWHEYLLRRHVDRKSQQQWRTRQVVESPQGREVTIEGRTYLNFCSNDYLGLANHPQVVAAATHALQQFGLGSGASHLVCGHLAEHEALELEIAEFFKSEKAIVFSSGYMANLAIPQAFLGRSDLLVQDRLNHASLIDAGKACDAKMLRYPHRDYSVAAERLASSGFEKRMLMTDGVFSMDGTVAELGALKALCDQHNALLVVDEAHGLGVLGASGRGAHEQAGLTPTGNLLVMGTLGKACGSFGAFVVGNETMIEHLVQFARTYIYTTALPPSLVAGARTALNIIQNEPNRLARLTANVVHFRMLSKCGGLPFGIQAEEVTPIVPVLLDSEKAALQASQRLREMGFLVSAIRPPTVPANTSRLRITFSAEHRSEDIEKLFDALTVVLSECSRSTK